MAAGYGHVPHSEHPGELGTNLNPASARSFYSASRRLSVQLHLRDDHTSRTFYTVVALWHNSSHGGCDLDRYIRRDTISNP